MTTIETEPAVAQATDPDAVAERLIGIVNDGAICLFTSIGHELGLFETLASMPAATSEQIGDAAGLDERYVREWLGGVVTAGFVDYHPDTRTYSLRPDHTPFVTGDGVDNLARMTRYITLMGQVAPLVAEKFRTGGGLSYEDYPTFHTLMAAESAAVNDASLLDVIVPLTGVTARLESGIDVADIGCGQGHAINLLARAYPRSRFVGYDFSEEAIEAARDEAAESGLTNARFEVQDVAGLDAESAYDLVLTFDAIHDQAHPAQVLANIHRSLRPDGTYLMVDINTQSNLEDNLGLPWAAVLYAMSTFHCMSVSLGQGGDGLGAVWGVQTAQRMLHEAGFTDVVLHELEEDPFNAYFVAR
ncbi:class I SAM-dependent methyltransferase, partial [Nocardioides sp.]|uniref:class I SAM-dependent methyltransferase n=1 Tax=Nocardioides sp. TaxID=35761 RepID=UPI002ED010B1